MIRVVVAGAAGRMGRLTVTTLRAEADVELAGTLVRGSDAAAVLALARPDVLVDFTLAAASREISLLAAERGISPVIGTSGLRDEDVARIAEACRRSGTGGLLVPNFSVGAVLQMRLAEEVARHLPCAGIHEVHHPQKKDSPSGTALATARRIRAAAAQAAGAGGGAADVPIRSERREGALAEQEVAFEQPGERLVLGHVVTDRQAYMPGLLLAVRSVRSLHGLHVGLDALLAPPAA